MSKSSKETKKNKRCKKGTRRNPKTGNCDPIIEPEPSIIEQIKDSVLNFHPIQISQVKQIPENIDIIEKKGNLKIKVKKNKQPQPQPQNIEEKASECNKNYVLLETDIKRSEELKDLTGQELRNIHYELTNDESVLPRTKGIKTKDELIRLIICLENEKNEKNKKIGYQIPDIFSMRGIDDIEKKIPEEPFKEPVPIVETKMKPIKKKLNIILNEPIENEETKIDLEIPNQEEQKEEENKEQKEEENKEQKEEQKEKEVPESNKITKKENELQEKIGIPHPNIESKEYNSFLFEKEKIESENLKTNDSFPFLYPELNDPNFNIKIAKHKEFNDTQYDGSIKNIKEQANYLCNAEFELSPYQLFVKNFLSVQTPYNCLLLYHSLGTGKTLSSIGIAEEMRLYMKQIGLNQPILVIASPNVQQNYRLQLFDERKLKLVNGLWTSNTNVSNALLKEINPTNLTGIPKDRIISEVNTIINKHYFFMGYIELANYIKRHTGIPEGTRFSMEEQKILRNKKIRKYFDNRLIIIDEAHNIRISDDNREESKTASLLMEVARYANNMRLLLLSATPMYNNYKEIIWITNLMNTVDKRSLIREDDIFDKEGGFVSGKTTKDGKVIEDGKEILKRKLTGYISYVRGENPYTFPFRIYPETFLPENSLSNILNEKKYPTKQLNQRTIENPLSIIPVFISEIGEYQEKGYDFIMKHLRNKSFSTMNKFGEVRELPSFENMESFGYTLLMQPLQALNIIFPNPAIDNIREEKEEKEEKEEEENYPEERNEEIIKNIIGKRGLYNIMTRKEEKTPIPNIYDFEYKSEKTYGRIFHPDNIGKYSNKIAKICNSIRNSKGIIIIYSQYIEGGIIPIALALEEMGFGRFSIASHAKNLFKTPYGEPIDSVTMKTHTQYIKDGGEPNKFNRAKYVMITGNKAFSPDNLADIKYVTHPDNNNGEKVKVILISKAGSEGLDFKCIRQVHILEPWYNMSRIEQIIGRGVRNLSHCSLDFEDRNVEIYLHSTLPRNDEEPADLYVYRFAEKKAIAIGKVTRLLKEVAVDCILNIGQTNFTVEKLASLAENKEVKIKLSSKNGEEIIFPVGDKPFTAICDYADNCSFTCSPNEEINEKDIIMDMYNDDYLKINYLVIVKRIRQLFRERNIYSKEELINSINLLKVYPINHIDYALSRFVDNKTEYIYDRWGRTGYLINRDNYYAFQPSEITDETISLFERGIPRDENPEYVEIELPKQKGPLLIEESVIPEESDIKTETITNKNKDEKYGMILNNLREIFNIVEEWRTKKREGSQVPSGQADWYTNMGFVIDHIIENHKIKESEIKDFIIFHYLDCLSFEERMIIVKYLNQESSSQIFTDYDNVFKKYFDEKIVKVRGFKTIVLINDKIVDSNEERLKIYIQNNNGDLLEWNPAEPTDRINAIKETIQTSLVQYSNLSRMVGFMNVFRNNDIVFKTMDMQNSLKKGSRCASEGKKDIIKKINIISKEIKYNEENTENENLILKQGLCVILEVLLRYYTNMNVDNKVWFLNLEKAVISKLVK
uniref:Helicase ATP-binding domain-containing protein n=1 Tax=viral metagenome TaxID=1070528 RepID=A0A6C0HST2_9ZZZZ